MRHVGIISQYPHYQYVALKQRVGTTLRLKTEVHIERDNNTKGRKGLFIRWML